jgi:hypothetical protein
MRDALLNEEIFFQRFSLSDIPLCRGEKVVPQRARINTQVGGARLLNGNEHSLEKMNATAEITSQARGSRRRVEKKSRWLHSEARMKFSAILFVSYLGGAPANCREARVYVCVCLAPLAFLSDETNSFWPPATQFLPPGRDHKFETCGGGCGVKF